MIARVSDSTGRAASWNIVCTYLTASASSKQQAESTTAQQHNAVARINHSESSRRDHPNSNWFLGF